MVTNSLWPSNTFIFVSFSLSMVKWLSAIFQPLNKLKQIPTSSSLPLKLLNFLANSYYIFTSYTSTYCISVCRPQSNWFLSSLSSFWKFHTLCSSRTKLRSSSSLGTVWIKHSRWTSSTWEKNPQSADFQLTPSQQTVLQWIWTKSGNGGTTSCQASSNDVQSYDYEQPLLL